MVCFAQSSVSITVSIYPGLYSYGGGVGYGAGSGVGAGGGGGGGGTGGGGAGGGGAYYGPLARPVVLRSGFLADTHEVAATRAAHLTALATRGGAIGAGSGTGSGSGGGAGAGAGVGGGYATPVVLPSGFLADTHEVAAARAAHLSLVSGIRSGLYGAGAGGGAGVGGGAGAGAYGAGVGTYGAGAYGAYGAGIYG